MDELFKGLLERARYYEQFEQFRRPAQIMHYREVDLCQVTQA